MRGAKRRGNPLGFQEIGSRGPVIARPLAAVAIPRLAAKRQRYKLPTSSSPYLPPGEGAPAGARPQSMAGAVAACGNGRCRKDEGGCHVGPLGLLAMTPDPRSLRGPAARGSPLPCRFAATVCSIDKKPRARRRTFPWGKVPEGRMRVPMVPKEPRVPQLQVCVWAGFYEFALNFQTSKVPAAFPSSVPACAGPPSPRGR